MAKGWTDMPYDVPNLSIENGPAKAHVRIGWLRSVANIYHGFGIQCFTDELANRAHRDPYEYLLDLLGAARTVDFKNVEDPTYGASLETCPWETGRLRRVREVVAERSGWAHKKSDSDDAFGTAADKSVHTC